MDFRYPDHTYDPGSAELTDTDPLAGLKSLARQVAKSGIRRVEGDVLIDDRLFEAKWGSGGNPELRTPIVVNDNVVDFVVQPGAAIGLPGQVSTRPAMILGQMDCEVTTVEPREKTEVHFSDDGFGGLLADGHIPLGGKPFVRASPMFDPVGSARKLFLGCLRGEGITITKGRTAAGSQRVFRVQRYLPDPDAYADMPRVAVYVSPPLSEFIKVTLKVSHNLYADMLVLLVAAKHGYRTFDDGLRLERQILARLGVDVRSICFASGAGPEIDDCVTPRATIRLLQALARRPDYHSFHAGLPILGVDETDYHPAGGPARGRIHAKPGGWLIFDEKGDRFVVRSQSLAGTITTASGRRLVFAIFLNNVPLPKGADLRREAKVLGHLCEILWASS